jgi:hypothetical protein
VRRAVDWLTARSGHVQAPGEQALIQGPPEGDLHWLGGPGAWRRQQPAVGVDMTSLVAAGLISPVRSGSQGESLRIMEPGIDYEPESLASSQRVAGILVGGQAAFDPGRVQQDREPAAGGTEN